MCGTILRKHSTIGETVFFFKFHALRNLQLMLWQDFSLFLGREAVIAAIPSYEEPYIKVPKVLNKEWCYLGNLFLFSFIFEWKGVIKKLFSFPSILCCSDLEDNSLEYSSKKVYSIIIVRLPVMYGWYLLTDMNLENKDSVAISCWKDYFPFIINFIALLGEYHQQLYILSNAALEYTVTRWILPLVFTAIWTTFSMNNWFCLSC